MPYLHIDTLVKEYRRAWSRVQYYEYREVRDAAHVEAREERDALVALHIVAPSTTTPGMVETDDDTEQETAVSARGCARAGILKVRVWWQALREQLQMALGNWNRVNGQVTYVAADRCSDRSHRLARHSLRRKLTF